MSKNLFITATESRSGKSVIALGVMELLLRNIDRVGFFRPLINIDPAEKKKDNDIDLIASYFKLDIPYEAMYAYTTAEANELIALGKLDDLLDGIFTKYKEIEKETDFVLCEGTDYMGSTSAFEFDINAAVANNLGCPVLLVASAHQKTVEETLNSIEISVESLIDKGCDIVATIINRTDPKKEKKLVNQLKKSDSFSRQSVYAIPEAINLGNPTVGEIARLTHAEVLYGKEHLNRHVYSFTVAAMELRNFLRRIEHGTLIITPGDRSDVIVACLASVSSVSMPNISGIMLTGGLKPEKPICELIEGFADMVPIISVKENTFPAARIVDNVHAVILPEDKRKITQALELFEKKSQGGGAGEKNYHNQNFDCHSEDV